MVTRRFAPFPFRRVKFPPAYDQPDTSRERPAAGQSHRLAGCRQVQVRLGSGRVEVGQRRASPGRLVITEPPPHRRWLLRLGRRRTTPRTASDGVARLRLPRGRVRLDLPGDVALAVRVRRGLVSSWAASAPLQVTVGRGRVAARELTSRRVAVDCPCGEVSLHFAAAPDEVTVTARRVVLVVPDGPYAVQLTARDAECAVPVDAAAARRLVVRARSVRVVSAQPPVPLVETG